MPEVSVRGDPVPERACVPTSRRVHAIFLLVSRSNFLGDCETWRTKHDLRVLRLSSTVSPWCRGWGACVGRSGYWVRGDLWREALIYVDECVRRDTCWGKLWYTQTSVLEEILVEVSLEMRNLLGKTALTYVYKNPNPHYTSSMRIYTGERSWVRKYITTWSRSYKRKTANRIGR